MKTHIDQANEKIAEVFNAVSNVGKVIQRHSNSELWADLNEVRASLEVAQKALEGAEGFMRCIKPCSPNQRGTNDRPASYSAISY